MSHHLHDQSGVLGGRVSRTRRKLNHRRLDAAVAASGHTWHRLGTVAGISPPTLSRLRRRRTKLVNRVTLERLADALDVPLPWLTGDIAHLPFVSAYDPPHPKGDGRSRWEYPTPDDIQWSALMRNIDGAIRRDLHAWVQPAREATIEYDAWGHALRGVFVELGSFLSWRGALLVSLTGGTAPLPRSERPGVAWCRALLEPWLLGKARLNVTGLRGVLEVLRGNPDREFFWGDSRARDEKSDWALREYEKLAKKKLARAQEQEWERLGPDPG